MKKLFLVGCTALIFSCNNTDEFDHSLDAKVSKPAGPATPNSPQVVQQPSTPLLTPAPGLNNTPVITTATNVTTPPAPAQATTAAGKNPPHGQPGHRCDLPVGAALTGATPAKGTPPPKNVTLTPSTVTTVKTAVGPGMNPAHGEPGHRCDISVGAPLNSAPAKKEEDKKTEARADSSSN